jgi:N-sulfoglucosamine sulfohydrolase
MSRYYGEITYMDGQVATMLRHLKELKLEQNTVVLWLSEQGSQLPFGKWTYYDTGVHAAAVLRWPGKVKRGSESSALVRYVDVVPTFFELAGGRTASVDGKSFAPLLRGETEQHNDVVFSVNTTRGIYHGSEAFGIRSATDGRWLYIRNLHSDNDFQNMVTHRDPVFASWKTVESDFAQQRVNSYVRRAPEEFYDLVNDPWCVSNLAATSFHHDEMLHLSARMDVWMKQQGDPGDATERATERAAESRQPRQRPWSRNGEYVR